MSQVIAERSDKVLVFDVTPEQMTGGTSYVYFRKFPNFDEELYYLLECSTLNNTEESEVVKKCQEVVDARNAEALEKWNSKRTDPHEFEISLSDIDYTISDLPSPDLPGESICDE